MSSNSSTGRCFEINSYLRKKMQAMIIVAPLVLIPISVHSSVINESPLIFGKHNEVTVESSSSIIVLKDRVGASHFANINRRLSKESADKIIKEVDKYLSEYGESGLAYEIKGTALFNKKQFLDAKKAFQKASKLDSNFSGPRAKLGITEMELGQLAEAEINLKKAVTIDKSNRVAHQRLGMLYEYNNKYALAIDHFRQGLVGTDSHYLGVAVNLGRVLNKTKKYQDTILIMEPRLPINSPVFEAHFILASAYLATGRYDFATQRFERVLELKPDVVEARLGVARALRLKGDIVSALELFQQIAKEYPDLLVVQLELGETYLQLNQPIQARKVLDAAAGLGGNYINIQHRLASFHISRNEFLDAIKIYQNLIDSHKTTPVTYAKNSELLRGQGKHQESLQLLRDGLKSHPESGYLYLKLGSDLALLRQYEEAEAALEQAFHYWPNDPKVLKAYSLVLSRLGKTNNAARIAERLHKLLPDSVGEAVFYAAQLQADQQLKNAEKVYRDVAKAEPKNPAVLNNLASLLAGRGALSEAEEFARRANEIAQDNGQILDTLGWILYKQGHLEEAGKILDKAIEKAPNVAIAYYHRGVAYADLGNKSAAVNALNKALEMSPKAKWAADARARLNGDA